MNVRTIERREDGAVILLDQRKLPAEETYRVCESWEDVADSIQTMVVRGAPAIGVTAAYGVALAARDLAQGDPGDRDAFASGMEHALDALAKTRPTAVNLFWALDRMKRLVASAGDASPSEVAERLATEATAIHEEDRQLCLSIGKHGAELVPDGARVLTHCNTGALATGGIGTALGVVRAAKESGKSVLVWADETRPWLQGARLTTWECQKDSIPVKLVPDSVAADLMRRGQVDVIIVGADRIASNGDTANKIGTYSVAVAAHHHGVPFYVAAPLTTIDRSLADGSQIPIEERDPSEVTQLAGVPIAPGGVEAFNPAFDVTPARLIKGIITDRGVARAPYPEAIAALFGD